LRILQPALLLALAGAQGLEASAIVADGKPVQDLSLGIDHAYGVTVTPQSTPTSTAMVVSPPGGLLSRLPGALAGFSFIALRVAAHGAFILKPGSAFRPSSLRRSHAGFAVQAAVAVTTAARTKAPPAYRPNQVEVAE
jgi:hypothetical protein